MAFPTGYSKYQEVTIKSSKVPADLTDYRAYINLTDLSMKGAMVHWLKLNEASGNRADSHNSNDFTAYNSPSNATGKVGDAIDLNGTNQYIDIATAAKYDWGGRTRRSFVFWFYADDVSGVQTILSKWDGSYQDYILYLNGSTLTLGGGGSTLATKTSISASTWYCVTVNLYEDATGELFVNAVSEGSGNRGSSGSGTTSLRIGQNSGSNHFNGRVDGFVFFNTVLPQHKIDWYYNSGDGRDYEDLPNDIFDTCRSDGGDIRATKSDGTTQLPAEIASINTTDCTGEVYVKYTGTLSSSSDTVIRLYYNGTDTALAVTDTYGRNNVWGSDYEFVFHFNEDPSGSAPQMVDSTGNGDATSVGTMTAGDSVEGLFGDGGKAVELDGSDDYFTRSVIEFSSNDPLGLTCLVKMAGGGSDNQSRMMSRLSSGNDAYLIKARSTAGGWYIHPRTNASNESRVYQNTVSEYIGTTQNEINIGHATLPAATSESSYKIYKDGASATLHLQESAISSNQNLDIDCLLCESGSPTKQGAYDEMRLANFQYSGDWVTVETNNLREPQTFMSVGEEQGGGGGEAAQNSNLLMFA